MPNLKYLLALFTLIPLQSSAPPKTFHTVHDHLYVALPTCPDDDEGASELPHNSWHSIEMDSTHAELECTHMVAGPEPEEGK